MLMMGWSRWWCTVSLKPSPGEVAFHPQSAQLLNKQNTDLRRTTHMSSSKQNSTPAAQQDWEVFKYKMAVGHFKGENKALRNDLKNTKIFLHMVIHDLRNPNKQINFALPYASEKLEQAQSRQEQTNLEQRNQYSSYKDAQAAFSDRVEKALRDKLKEKDHEDLKSSVDSLQKAMVSKGEEHLQEKKTKEFENGRLRALVESKDDEIETLKKSIGQSEHFQNLLEDAEQHAAS